MTPASFARAIAVLAAVAVTTGVGPQHAARAATPAAAADPAAVATVKRYLTAIAKPDLDAAFALLTPAQQHYFGNPRNFASNYATTGYRLVSWSVARVAAHGASLVEVDVDQKTSYYDIATAQTLDARATEPYFALRSGKRWGAKEIYVPWKSYAPKTVGRAGALSVIVDRVEFYDRRVQVDCTLRNLGQKPVQVLPLLRSTLRLDGVDVAALAGADFPLNDRQFFEGVRIYEYHQVVGYINFPLSSRADRALVARLTVGPVVEDGGAKPLLAEIGPIELPKL
jgi:hypothetical protein